MSKSVLAAATFAAALCAAPALAQTAQDKPTKSATKVAKSTKSAKSTKATKPEPAPVVLPAADQEQLEAAGRTHYGQYACEFDQSVDVVASTRAAGYVDVKYKKSIYTMKPVVSQTGALRLEDVTGRTLMLQIANKSMLMDTKIGQRLVDNCIHPEQAKFNASRT